MGTILSPPPTLPGLTGDVTSSAGSTVTAIGSNKVTNAMMAQAPAFTMKGNHTGSTGNEEDLSVAQINALLGGSSGPINTGFGDGSDGTATMDGVATVAGFSLAGSTYTALRETFFANLTINVGIICKPDGYIIRVNGTLTNNGVITVTGGNAVGQTRGTPPFSGSRQLPNGTLGGGFGQNGDPSTTAPRGMVPGSVAGGPASTSTPGAAGGIGQGGGGGGGGVGGGDAGGNGGLVTIASAVGGDIHNIDRAAYGRTQVIDSFFTSYSAGGSGGGGGNAGGNGGAGGAGGGWMTIWAVTFAGSGTYESKGGNGDNLSPLGGGGGGGGGSGGVVVLISGTTTPPTPVLTGGLPGPGGTLNGASGGNGGLGIFYSFICK